MAIDLQQRIRAFLAGGSDNFAELALEVFAFQCANNPIYRAYCERQPAPVRSWKAIPAVPTSAFKDFPIACFPLPEAVAEFHTSGTTREKAGKHYFKTLELYEAAIRPNFEQHLLVGPASPSTLLGTLSLSKGRLSIVDTGVTEVDRRDACPTSLPVLALTPSPKEAPHSSLAHMLGVVGGSDCEFFVEQDTLLLERLTHRLCEMQWANQPVLLLGTAFAFVHLFDHLGNTRFELPEGSRAMETGGFKGRSRAVTKPELYQLFTRQLGIPAHRIVNEYGMTELSTQFYDATLRHGSPTDHKDVPPWSRILIMDPRTGQESPLGERGLIRVFDLANLWSCQCIQTEDLGIAHADGTFEVLGRAENAEVRGCSLNAESFRKE